MTASIIFSVGCSYIPWIQKDEDDLAFEEDFPFDDIREGGGSRDKGSESMEEDNFF